MDEQKTHSEVAVHPPDEQTRILAMLGYIPLLCILPLFAAKKDAFALWHGKQGLVITFLALIESVLVPRLIVVIPFFGGMLASACSLAVLILAVLGGWHAYKGEKWELPFVGKFAQNIKF